MKRKLRVAVLMGGKSSERDISLISANEVIKYLDRTKYLVGKYDPATDLLKLIAAKNKIDVVLPILHGPGGEDGSIQGFLELLELPYIGSGVLASALAMNKQMAKKIYQQAGINTPDGQLLTSADEQIKIKLPVVVKPLSQGSSMGTTVVKKTKDLRSAIKLAFKFETEVLVEEFISGIEITVPILGNENPQALPIIEIVPPEGKFFDRQVKYNGSTQEIIPARISKTLTDKVKQIGVLAHQALGCRGLSRTDMIIRQSLNNKQPEIFVLETNTIPGMTSESLFPKAAKQAGIEFSDLLERLIQLSLQK